VEEEGEREKGLESILTNFSNMHSRVCVCETERERERDREKEREKKCVYVCLRERENVPKG
jgi:hypothetical protein